jgi:hypothetical protein
MCEAAAFHTHTGDDVGETQSDRLPHAGDDSCETQDLFCCSHPFFLLFGEQSTQIDSLTPVQDTIHHQSNE